LRKSLDTYLRVLKPDCGPPGPIGNILARITCTGTTQSFFISEKREEQLAACLPSKPSFQQHHWPWDPTCEQIWIQQDCFVISHSQQPRKPTDNSMFSQIRTRAMIHETTGTLPCHGDGKGLLHPTYYICIVYHHAISPTQIALMDVVKDSHADRVDGRLERIPTQIALMDVVKRPLLTRGRR
jgi:hypothetical protein